MFKKVISIVIVLALVFVGGFFTAKQLVPDSTATSNVPKYSTKPVIKGDIKQGVNITGQLNGNWGGTIGAPAPEGITDSSGSPVTLTYKVEEILIEPNDMVKKGDNLVRLSAANLGDILDDLNEGIGKKQQEIQEINDTINRKIELLGDTINKDIKSVNEVDPNEGIVICAPIKGRLSEMNIEEGDIIENGYIARIVDDSKVKIPFKVNEVEYNSFKVGDKVLLQFRKIIKYIDTNGEEKQREIPSFDGFYTGVIKSLNVNAVPNSDSISYIHNGMIEVENPGLVQPDMKAIIYRQKDGAPVEGLTYNAIVSSYVNEKKVFYTGNLDTTVIATEVLVRQNDFIEEGQTLIKIAGNDVAKSIQSKIDEIELKYDEIKTKNEEIEDLHEKIDKISELTSKLMVTAPMDGMVSYVNYMVGDTIDASATSDRWSLQLVDMYNTNDMNIYTTVSDLDVLYIKQDAPVEITVDALPGEKFEGEVMGLNQYTNREGKTVYNVEISVVGREGLRPGMNTNCFINSGEASDTLLVPIEAVFEEDNKQKVEILNESGEVEVVEIEVGLMNDKQVEVLSGLEEGQEVVTGSTKDLMPSQSVPQNDSILPQTNNQ